MGVDGAGEFAAIAGAEGRWKSQRPPSVKTSTATAAIAGQGSRGEPGDCGIAFGARTAPTGAATVAECGPPAAASNAASSFARNSAADANGVRFSSARFITALAASGSPGSGV